MLDSHRLIKFEYGEEDVVEIRKEEFLWDLLRYVTFRVYFEPPGMGLRGRAGF